MWVFRPPLTPPEQRGTGEERHQLPLGFGCQRLLFSQDRKGPSCRSAGDKQRAGGPAVSQRCSGHKAEGQAAGGMELWAASNPCGGVSESQRCPAFPGACSPRGAPVGLTLLIGSAAPGQKPPLRGRWHRLPRPAPPPCVRALRRHRPAGTPSCEHGVDSGAELIRCSGTFHLPQHRLRVHICEQGAASACGCRDGHGSVELFGLEKTFSLPPTP